MKKIAAVLLALGSFIFSFTQDSTVINPEPEPLDTTVQIPTTITPDTLVEEAPQRRSPFNQFNPVAQPKDHLLIQLAYDNWSRMPDSIQTRGLSRGFNVYFMYDFPFKSNPRLSIAVGAGISTSNIYFKDTYIDITGKNANKLGFNDVSDTTHFKKYKLLTTFLEAPVEFRYVANPVNSKKSFKAAVGAKIGTLLSATTKGKILLNSAGNTVNSFTQKEKAKRFFNSTRLSVTGRVGYGNLSLFGSYQVNAFIKEGFGPDVRPYSIGITLSGL